MFGKILSSAVKLATLPVDVLEIGIDAATGGDGSRREMRQADMPLISDLRDKVCRAIEDID